MIDRYVKPAMRRIAGAANVALALLFLYGAARLYAQGSARLAEAGGLGGFDAQAPHDLSGLLNALAAFLVSPGAAGRVAGYGAAWLCFVAAAGCAWMAILGGRWIFNAIARSS